MIQKVIDIHQWSLLKDQITAVDITVASQTLSICLISINVIRSLIHLLGMLSEQGLRDIICLLEVINTVVDATTKVPLVSSS